MTSLKYWRFDFTRRSPWVETVRVGEKGRSHDESKGTNSAWGFSLDARFAHAACHCLHSGTVLTQGLCLVHTLKAKNHNSDARKKCPTTSFDKSKAQPLKFIRIKNKMRREKKRQKKREDRRQGQHTNILQFVLYYKSRTVRWTIFLAIPHRSTRLALFDPNRINHSVILKQKKAK